MRKTLLSLCIAMASLSVFAAPARKGSTVIKLVNGTELKASLQGDEFLHYYLAEDGKCYKQNADGLYELMDVPAARENARMKRAQINKNMGVKRQRMMKADEKKGYFGQKKGLIMLVQFPDRSFQSAHDKNFYENFANKENYTDGSFKGSVRDYYHAQSGGQFELTFDVIGPLTAPKESTYYGENYPGGGSDKHVGELVAWALEQCKGKVDFTQYDWDKDGYVDQVFLLYAGRGENYEGAASTNIWPHMFYLQHSDYGKVFDTGQGVYVNTYACSCELNPDKGCDGIGTVCHEFSHCLGFADMYDTTYSGGYGMDDWDLLHSGCYNGNGFCPAGFTGYEKWVAGWIEPIELTKDKIVSAMKPLSEGGETYIMYNENYRDEYYIIDNRQKTKWDASLPGQGLLVTHVDYLKSAWDNNNVNDDPTHQRMTVVHADNMAAAHKAAYDTYPYMVNGVVKNDSLTDTSKPAATLFNANIDGSKFMGKALLDIKQNDDKTVAFRFRGLPGMNIDITPGAELFYESFDSNAGKGGNDDVWTATSTSALKTDVSGWVYNKGYAANKCARFGSKAVPGEASTPTFNVPCKVRLTFKAAPYQGDDNTVDVYFGNKMLERFFMEEGKWNDFSVEFEGNGYDRIYFNGGQRFFLDEVKVCVAGETGIEDVKVGVQTNDGRIYTVDGRYVGNSFNALGRGIYIQNGKKYVK